MITSAKNYTKREKKKTPKNKNGPTEPQDKWWKQSHTDKITQRSIYIHTQKKRKRKKIYICIYIKKEESNQMNKQIYQ